MSGVQPHDTPAPAEAGHRRPVGPALAGLLGPAQRGVQILHDLGVRHLADDGQNLPDIGQLRDIPLAGVQFGRNGQIAQLGQPPTDILDVFVHAKDFLHDEHDRQGISLRGRGPVGRDCPVGDRDVHLTGRQTVQVGRDRLG